MTSFKISSWNIHGPCSSAFGNKSTNSDFVQGLRNMDIAILQETWNHAAMPTLCPPQYIEIILPLINKPNIKYGLASGGIITWCHEKFKNSITPIKTGESRIRLRLKQQYTCVQVTSHYTCPPVLTRTFPP